MEPWTKRLCALFFFAALREKISSRQAGGIQRVREGL
jgi:hypothetical protein